MNTKWIILLIVTLFFFSLIFNIDNCFAVNKKVAEILFVEGTVKIKRAGSKTWIKAEEFDPLYKNDEIKSAKKSTVEIELSHGDIVLISSSSHFKILNYTKSKKQRKGTFFLSIGKV